jgi:plasmid rolling circle replication initiator protein Rep
METETDLNSSKAPLICQGHEVLVDRAKDGGVRPWRSKKIKNLQLAESYRRIDYLRKSERVESCATFLTFEKLEADVKRLVRANFCKVRLCPMCKWRTMLKVYNQVSKVMNHAIANYGYSFIFVTLTCRNVPASELKDTLANLARAFNAFTKYKRVSRNALGWFRALEVTHNLNPESLWFDTYHGHYHVVLMMRKDYFRKRGEYLDRGDLAALWQRALKAPYLPQVDVRGFNATSPGVLAKSIAEVAKYTVKDVDYLSPDPLMTDETVRVLDSCMRGRRLYAYGGLLKAIHKELNLKEPEAEDADLIDLDDEPMNEGLVKMIESYSWRFGLNQYTGVRRAT